MKNYLVDLILRRVATVVKRILPSTRAAAFMLLIGPLVQQDKPERALRFLFELENRLYELEGQTSVRYGGGIHTKHRHTNYHQFFIKNLKPGERVLDVGSGNGFLAYDVVTSVKNICVVGIELNKSNVKFACEHYQHPNLVFVHGDVLKNIPQEKFDVIILSNVLEHIECRVDFLKKLTEFTRPKRLLIRVPQYDRDWRVPLKNELGVDSRLDRAHFIEYTREKFLEELSLANLRPTHMEFRWGEIWSVAEPLSKVKNND
ncbi:methyltransferase [subsurface metagenome]